MSIHSPLKILVTGSSLITSSSLWFFNSSLPISARSGSSSTRAGDPSPNLFTAEKKLPNRNGTKLVDNDLQKDPSSSGSSGLYITLKSNSKKIYLAPFNAQLINMELGWISSLKSQYDAFDHRNININLFSKSAWHGNTGNDEYENKVSEAEVSELFDMGLDSLKVKQLLLSLHRRTEWQKYGGDGEPKNFFAQNEMPQSLDDLKNLKIKHFKEFSKLKEYIEEKVSSCKGEELACVAHIDELDYLETDRKSFFE